MLFFELGFMTKKQSVTGFIILLGVAMLLAGLVASCAPDKSAPVLEARITPTSPDNVSADLITTEMVADLEPFTDTECLDCHTDQVRLVELALPEEAGETLSEGPG